MATATLPFPNTRDLAAIKTSTRRQRRILLIEDNKDAMRWVQNALKKYASERYALEWAQCLSEGLRRLANGGIDLVLLDLGLSDCSSPYSFTWVHEASPEVPIVVLTGDASDETGSSMAANGGQRYLVKGEASARMVVNTIAEALG
jgi:DNA-binding response OmpR family regulator